MEIRDCCGSLSATLMNLGARRQKTSARSTSARTIAFLCAVALKILLAGADIEEISPQTVLIVHRMNGRHRNYSGPGCNSDKSPSHRACYLSRKCRFILCGGESPICVIRGKSMPRIHTNSQFLFHSPRQFPWKGDKHEARSDQPGIDGALCLQRAHGP
jgi:hypothetical protein